MQSDQTDSSVDGAAACRHVSGGFESGGFGGETVRLSQTSSLRSKKACGLQLGTAGNTMGNMGNTSAAHDTRTSAGSET